MNSKAPEGWQYSIDEMTREKIIELDSLPRPPVWLSHSWLGMMAYTLDGTQVGKDRYEFCDHVWDLKIKMRDEGYVFRIDKMC